MMLRSLMRGFVPLSMRHRMLAFADRFLLAAVPRGTFPLDNLRVLSRRDLDEILHYRATALTWTGDHVRADRLFGAAQLDGGISANDRRALYHLVRGLRPARVLEIGTHVGASTMYIARALKANDAGRLMTVDVVDVNAADGPWTRCGLAASPAVMVERINCAGLVEFVCAPSLKVLGEQHGPFDLIFLDGDHRPQAVYREIAASCKRLAPNGVIVLHDYYAEGTPLDGPYRALTRIQHEVPALRVEALLRLPWADSRGQHSTSLAVVTA